MAGFIEQRLAGAGNGEGVCPIDISGKSGVPGAPDAHIPRDIEVPLKIGFTGAGDGEVGATDLLGEGNFTAPGKGDVGESSISLECGIAGTGNIQRGGLRLPVKCRAARSLKREICVNLAVKDGAAGALVANSSGPIDLAESLFAFASEEDGASVLNRVVALKCEGCSLWVAVSSR